MKVSIIIRNVLMYYCIASAVASKRVECGINSMGGIKAGEIKVLVV